MMSMSALNADEYQLCRRRGHVGGIAITEGWGTTWSVCVHCGVRFRSVEKILEHDDDLERLDAGDRAVRVDPGQELLVVDPAGFTAWNGLAKTHIEADGAQGVLARALATLLDSDIYAICRWGRDFGIRERRGRSTVAVVH